LKFKYDKDYTTPALHESQHHSHTISTIA